eukprot:c18277_g1_i1 orf=169-918(+)
MASSRSSWRLGSLLPWQTLHSRVSERDVRGNSPLDIWNCLEEMMGGLPFQGSSLPEPPTAARLRFILEGDEDFWRHGGFADTRIRDWIVSRSLEMDECPPRPIDTRAVFNKCKREVFKPKSRGIRGKSTAEQQEDCPVCLEKFVVDQDLYSLPCNHKFHRDCLTPWIQSNHGDCPCCRADILKPKSKPASSTASATSNSGRINDRPSSSFTTSSNSSINGRSGRREEDDIISVLAAMEAALDRLGLSTY